LVGWFCAPRLAMLDTIFEPLAGASR